MQLALLHWCSLSAILVHILAASQIYKLLKIVIFKFSWWCERLQPPPPGHSYTPSSLYVRTEREELIMINHHNWRILIILILILIYNKNPVRIIESIKKTERDWYMQKEATGRKTSTSTYYCTDPQYPYKLYLTLGF